MNKKYYKKTKLSSIGTPIAPIMSSTNTTAQYPSNKPSTATAVASSVFNPPPYIYAPYMPFWKMRFVGDYKLTVQLLVSKEYYIPKNVYNESIILLNNTLLLNDIGKLRMVEWKLDKLKPLTEDTIMILFNSFSAHPTFSDTDLWPIQITKNNTILYYLNVSLLHTSTDCWPLSNHDVKISDAFRKNYDDKNSDLVIYLKGSMTVIINKEIKNIPNPTNPCGEQWKVIENHNIIKKITPKQLKAYDGLIKLKI